MKLVKHEKFEIGIHHRRGKVYWRPTWSIHNSNFFKVENGRKFQWMNCWSYFIATTIQLFFLKWIIYIEIRPKLISGEQPMRYVRFEETHLELLDLPHGSWTNSDKAPEK